MRYIYLDRETCRKQTADHFDMDKVARGFDILKRTTAAWKGVDDLLVTLRTQNKRKDPQKIRLIQQHEKLGREPTPEAQRGVVNTFKEDFMRGKCLFPQIIEYVGRCDKNVVPLKKHLGLTDEEFDLWQEGKFSELRRILDCGRMAVQYRLFHSIESSKIVFGRRIIAQPEVYYRYVRGGYVFHEQTDALEPLLLDIAQNCPNAKLWDVVELMLGETSQYYIIAPTKAHQINFDLTLVTGDTVIRMENVTLFVSCFSSPVYCKKVQLIWEDGRKPGLKRGYHLSIMRESTGSVITQTAFSLTPIYGVYVIGDVTRFTQRVFPHGEVPLYQFPKILVLVREWAWRSGHYCCLFNV